MNFDAHILTYVSLDGVNLPHADLSGVKTLILENLHATWMHQCLRDNNQLESLSLTNTSMAWRAISISPVLTHLTLDWQDPYTVIDAQWETPTLKNLTISRATPDFWGELKLILARHPHPARFASIKSLVLAYCDMSTMMTSLDLVVLSDAIPGLEELSFVKARPLLVLEKLSRHPSAWPLLTTICVDGVTIERTVAGM